jgi:hypothetical protein
MAPGASTPGMPAGACAIAANAANAATMIAASPKAE